MKRIALSAQPTATCWHHRTRSSCTGSFSRAALPPATQHCVLHAWAASLFHMSEWLPRIVVRGIRQLNTEGFEGAVSHSSRPLSKSAQ